MLDQVTILSAKELDRLGLKEDPVHGCSYSLLGPKDGDGSTLMLEARVAMARRHNEVHAFLPRYVRVDSRKTEDNLTGDSPMAKKKETGAQPAADSSMGATTTTAPGNPPDAKEVQKAFDANRGEWEKQEKERKAAQAKKKKEEEAKLKKQAAERKALKKKSVAPKGKSKKTAAAAKPEKAKPGAAPKKAGGIGGFVCDLLVKGKETDDILKAVKAQFPKARTSAASVAWYRSKLREEGKIK